MQIFSNNKGNKRKSFKVNVAKCPFRTFDTYFLLKKINNKENKKGD